MQVNVEVLILDKRSFITDEEKALQALFGDSNDTSAVYRTELGTMATRLASAFAAMKVWPGCVCVGEPQLLQHMAARLVFTSSLVMFSWCYLLWAFYGARQG